MEPFASSLDHLFAELQRVELLLRLHVEQARRAESSAGGQEGAPPAPEGATLAPTGQSAADDASDLQEAQASLDRMSEEIPARVRRTAPKRIPLRLPAIARRLGLSRFDVEVVLLALLPEVEPRVGDLHASLRDSASERLPSVDLILELLCPSFEARAMARARFVHEAPLIRHGVIHLVGAAPHTGLLDRSVKVDERIVEYLHGSDELDTRLRPCARLLVPGIRFDDLVLPAGLEERLSRFVGDTCDPKKPAPIVCLKGPYGVGKRATAEALCQRLEKVLLIVDCGVLRATAEDEAPALMRLIEREALLLDAVMYYEDADTLPTRERPILRAALVEALETHPGLVFLSGSGSFEPGECRAIGPSSRSSLPRPGAADQVRLWRGALAADLSPEMDLDVLTGTFRLTGGQILDAAAAARSMARFRDPAASRVTQEELPLRLPRGFEPSADVPRAQGVF